MFKQRLLVLWIGCFWLFNSCASPTPKIALKEPTKQKMKIEIWSDIACPFCYIGKHKLDKALANFKDSSQIEIVWKSYQLNPELVTDTSKSIYQSLADSKGITLAYAQQMTAGVSQMGVANGIVFNFNQTVPANTFKAHILVHFAAKSNVQSEAKEKLFEAYFLEGKNIDDTAVLANIAISLGLNAEDFKLAMPSLEKEVMADIAEAQKMAISGVPYFVFDKKYAISGAQDDSVFTNTLTKAFNEFKANNSTPHQVQTIDGKVCTPKECK